MKRSSHLQLRLWASAICKNSEQKGMTEPQVALSLIGRYKNLNGLGLS